MNELYEFLRDNYVEDSDNTFRFDYPVEFLKWALLVPGYQQDWFLGVRYGKKKTLYGFISAIPVTMNVKDQKVKMVEINFLCVKKQLRSKGLGPVLIQEIRRRANVNSIW